ncbi:MAG: cytochrome c [Deltaproteobacteria bacterium]|nr:cytochrome c [Deltaproteobacteria bacterium]
MTTLRTPGLVALLLAAAMGAGCTASAADTPTPAATRPAAPPAAKPAAPMSHMAGGMMGADTRAAVPLTAMMAAHQKSQMRDHLRVIQEISVALAKDDYAAIAASAGRIGWSTQQAAMCKHMGAGAPGFAELGEAFHHTADTIVAAAKARDRAAVTTALGATLATCVGCHDAYRQEIVDDAAFAKLGGDTSCPMMGH